MPRKNLSQGGAMPARLLMQWREIEWELEPLSIHARPPCEKKYPLVRWIRYRSTVSDV